MGQGVKMLAMESYIDVLAGDAPDLTYQATSCNLSQSFWNKPTYIEYCLFLDSLLYTWNACSIAYNFAYLVWLNICLNTLEPGTQKGDELSIEVLSQLFLLWFCF